ncbi:hypothetical protein ABZW18_29420 [Streptomyces sp. NPDC004647]|uniref:hypothetical protein n=1 Tax=Streptomyces sp. NPDC004647 TaxID=3154671 RepID=UPI0033AAFE5F
MEAAILILALLFVVFVAVGAYVSVKLLSAAKRGVDRTVAQARRTVEDTTLKARQYAQPGAAGQLAELRLELRTSMRSTQDALHAASPEDVSLAEALRLFRQLSAHGHELDDDLKRLEREPDKARVMARLPELRERIERVVHHSNSLRWAAQDRARQFADEDLAALGNQIEVESGALRHWTTQPEQESGTGTGPAAQRSGASPSAHASAPVSAAASGSAAQPAAPPAASASVPTPTWPDVSRPDAASQEPPAITARDTRRQTRTPWEKARRPESTT